MQKYCANALKFAIHLRPCLLHYCILFITVILTLFTSRNIKDILITNVAYFVVCNVKDFESRIASDYGYCTVTEGIAGCIEFLHFVKVLCVTEWW